MFDSFSHDYTNNISEPSTPLSPDGHNSLDDSIFPSSQPPIFFTASNQVDKVEGFDFDETEVVETNCRETTYDILEVTEEGQQQQHGSDPVMGNESGENSLAARSMSLGLALKMRKEVSVEEGCEPSMAQTEVKLSSDGGEGSGDGGGEFKSSLRVTQRVRERKSIRNVQ